MQSFEFYGFPVPATSRNIKLILLVFWPVVLGLMFSAVFLSAWALSDVLNIGILFTLPLIAVLCLELKGNSKTVALLPKVLRGPTLHCFVALALYVFWTDAAYVKFSIVALFEAHTLAHKVLTAFWARKEKQLAERARMAQGLAELGYGQVVPPEDVTAKQ